MTDRPDAALTTSVAAQRFLLASDFDQTPSLNDSGLVSERVDCRIAFPGEFDGAAGINLVQQFGQLGYLIRHDPVE